MFLHIGEADYAFLVDDKGRAFRHPAHDEVGLGEKLLVSDAVCLGGGVLVIAEERDGDAFLLGPSGLGEGVIAGDREDLRVEILVGADAGGNVAQLGGANAGEGHGDEEKDDVGFADLVAEFHELRAVGGFGDEGEVWGFVACFDGHGVVCLVGIEMRGPI